MDVVDELSDAPQILMRQPQTPAAAGAERLKPSCTTCAPEAHLCVKECRWSHHRPPRCQPDEPHDGTTAQRRQLSKKILSSSSRPGTWMAMLWLWVHAVCSWYAATRVGQAGCP